MKRNKKLAAMATDELSPLTKKILTNMGPEGQEILTRLKKYMYEVMTAYSKFGENKVSNIGTER
jgi:hypothetical protein